MVSTHGLATVDHEKLGPGAVFLPVHEIFDVECNFDPNFDPRYLGKYASYGIGNNGVI